MNTRVTTSPLLVRLSSDLKDKLSSEARAAGKAPSVLAAEALDHYLTQTGAK